VQAMASYGGEAAPATLEPQHQQAATHLQLNIYAPDMPQHLAAPARK